MVSTQTVRDQLAERGFRNLVHWQRGVDTELFKPQAKDFLQLPRPIAAYVGRVAIEKNIDAFLRMPWTGDQARDRRWTGAAATEVAVPRAPCTRDSVLARISRGTWRHRT